LNSFEIIKEFQIMKGPSKVDNPIINKVDRYTIWGRRIHLHYTWTQNSTQTEGGEKQRSELNKRTFAL
jgi:hypothetical protein